MAIFNRVSIHDRPAVVEGRSHSGHWEADLMGFARRGQFLLVAHERKSRCSCDRT
jgi:IS30 family transposase